MKKRFNIIAAIDKYGGIGLANKLPWKSREDMNHFKRITTHTQLPNKLNCVIMGRKTWESCGFLKNRYNIIISNTLDDISLHESITICKSIEEGLSFAHNNSIIDKIWIIGGSQIYKRCFNHYLLDKIYLTKIDYEFNCDTFINLPKLDMIKNHTIQTTILKNIQKKNIIHPNKNIIHPNINVINTNIDFSINNVTFCEKQYLRLLEEIRYKGELINGRNGYVHSLLNKQLQFNLEDGFPLLTTKKMYIKGIFEELLFFIRGDTNTKKLEKQKINIWKGNTNRTFLNNQKKENYPEGQMGPMYGYQWRHYNKLFLPNLNSLDMHYLEINNMDEGIDQLSNIIEQIKTNPNSRRILMTDYNPLQVKQGVLYPCHSLIIQFFVRNKKLHLSMYQRSADVFLGLPFNIASTSLLLHIIAQLTNYTPGTVTINLGDCHIYKEHFDMVDTQLKRIPYKSPIIELPNCKTIKEIEQTTYKDYKIHNYQYYPSIKAKMIP